MRRLGFEDVAGPAERLAGASLCLAREAKRGQDQVVENLGFRVWKTGYNRTDQ
jgi:hypothetical protein